MKHIRIFVYINKITGEKVRINGENGKDAFFQLIDLKNISTLQYDDWELLTTT
jgi:hypothetical protein